MDDALEHPDSSRENNTHPTGIRQTVPPSPVDLARAPWDGRMRSGPGMPPPARRVSVWNERVAARSAPEVTR